MYKEIKKLLLPHWTDKQKKIVIARVAHALATECWYFVGAPSRKNVIIRVAGGEAFTEIVDCVPITEIYVPVSSVTSEIADLIPLVGCDVDEVAKGIAMRTWRFVRSGYEYKEPVLTVDLAPRKQPSLFDYCK